MVDVVLGIQLGDEGKGKITDLITENYDIVVRSTGGNNAGHTIVVDDKKYSVHMLPSGVVRDDTLNVIGNGCVVDPMNLKREIESLDKGDLIGRLFVSDRAHVIAPYHIEQDKLAERKKGNKAIGTTLRGIGPAYADKINRIGIRVGDLRDVEKVMEKARNVELSNNLLYETSREYWEEVCSFIKPYITDTTKFLNERKHTHKVLVEGAQAALLDIDHGSYPYVTSSNTTIGGALTGTGLNHSDIKRVIGVTKAYTTYVGWGNFPVEITDDHEVTVYNQPINTNKYIMTEGKEFGTTTGRERRIGWIDLVALKYAININGITEIALMKSDIMNGFNNVRLCEKYILNDEEIDHVPYDLTDITAKWKTVAGWKDKDDPNFANFISIIEKHVGVPVTIISYGPNREETFIK